MRLRARLAAGIAALLFFMLSGSGGLALAQEDARAPAEICADATPQIPVTRSFDAAEWVLQEDIDYRVILCTAAGAIYIDLYEEITPLTVNNFIFLAGQGYYDGTTFHRVLQDFMAQGGDPTGTGRGGPGYQFADEFVGFLIFDRPGLLAMANANNPERGITGTNGSQFFITFGETPWLNHRHTIFGEIVAGMDALHNLRLCDPSSCSEGDALHSALIITEPATVAAARPAVEAPAPQTVRQQLEDFFRERNFPNIDFAVEYLSQAELNSAAEQADDRELLDYLAEYGMEYRLDAGLETCASDYAPLRALRLALIAFPDEAAAQAAQAAGFWRLREAETLTPVETDDMPADEVYVGAGALCDDGRTRRLWMMYRLGANLLRAEASYFQPATGAPDEIRWLINARFFFEPLMTELIRAGLWAGSARED